MHGSGVEFARAQVASQAEFFVFRFSDSGAELWMGCDANPRVGIGWSDTKVSSLIH